MNNGCAFCRSSPLLRIVTPSLYQKYSTSISFYYSGKIDELMSPRPSQQFFKFEQAKLQSEDRQYLRRQYNQSQFDGKLNYFTEYYKFNRPVPLCISQQMHRPLIKYQDRLRKYDFKMVKEAIRKEQGLSITSQNSSEDQKQTPTRSKYPSLLHDLESIKSSDSADLNVMCNQINNKLGGKRLGFIFKGTFADNNKNFQQFLEKEKRKQSLAGRKKSHNDIFKEHHRIFPKNRAAFLKKQTIYKAEKSTSNHFHPRQQKPKEQKSREGQRYDQRKDQQRRNLFRPNQITINQMTRLPSNDKYNSNKSKNLLHPARPNKSKSFRRSLSKKTPSLTKISRQERPNLQTDRINKDDPKKVMRKTSTGKFLPMMKPSQNENINGFLLNQNSISRKDRSHSKSLSKSKSRAQLRQNNSSKKITRTISNFSELNLGKPKPIQKEKDEANKANRLLTKKLALYLKY